MVKVASLKNMQQHYTDGVFALSPVTGEQYSADPRDYFAVPTNWIMRDSNDEPMILARRVADFQFL